LSYTRNDPGSVAPGVCGPSARRASLRWMGAEKVGCTACASTCDPELDMTTIQDRLRLVPEFRSDERDGILEVLFGRLERRLSHWTPEQVELELSVKERGKPGQRTVLECWISGVPRMVATSTETDIDRAVVEVRDDLFRQLNRYVTRREDSRRG